MTRLRDILCGIGECFALFLLLVVVSCSAWADALDDFKKMPVEEQCGWKVKTFISAVEARETNHARKIIHVDKELMEQWIADGTVKQNQYGEVIMPLDGMYVMNWNHVSERSQEFISKVIYHGWDMANAWIMADIQRMEAKEPEWKGKLNAAIAPETKNQWATEYYKTCLMEYGEQRRIHYRSGGEFIKVQSEDLPRPKYQSYGIWKRIEGCMLNRGHYFQKCLDENQKHVRSQHDMYRMLEACDSVVLEKFFSCAALYPKD